jgi:selenocysteine lyase/cysteine desulfurase
MELQKRGIIEVTFLQPDEKGLITPKAVLEAVRQNTYMVIVCAVSNVTGQAQPIKEIGRALYDKRITYLVDCAQAAGYLPLNMEEFNIDMLAYPAHKGLHGVQGLGVLSFNERNIPNPINYGGTGSDSQNIYQPSFTPDSFESGTQNCPAIYALGAALDWWTLNYRVNLPKISGLCLLLHNELKNIKDVTLFSSPNASGIVAFDVAGRDSNEIGDLLSQRGIAVRSGLHCAPLMHKYLGSFERGLTRVSLSGENTVDDCYFLISALDKIIKEGE